MCFTLYYERRSEFINDTFYNYIPLSLSFIDIYKLLMKKASPVTFLARKAACKPKEQMKQELDLNIFVVTFNDMKDSQKKITQGDPYYCMKCRAIMNRYSVIKSKNQVKDAKNQIHTDMKPNESLWECQFCSYPNIIAIDKQEIPTKDDIFYLIQSQLQNQKGSENDSTMVFCIDTSGSMNTTSEIEGKVNLKYGLSQEQIDMLKTFMQPGDEAQFNFLPGNQNKNKTFISRKQCIFSAVESQLNEIKKNDPLKRVGFVTFNNEVTVIGDDHTPTVNILGDKLNNQQGITDSLNGFKLTQPLIQSFNTLIGQLNKQQAKGQTALGPGILSAIEIASKGSPGSTVILCTDGLANIGVGILEPLDQEKKKFYADLAEVAKSRNITVNIMTIKGEGCKMQVIGKLAQLTNGNMKVVNPEKLSDDFANVLKDQVVGINVDVIVKLHRAMTFRNQDKENLIENGSVLKKQYANATVNTKISFDYELRNDQDLKFMEVDVEKLKKVPFQAQILYSSPKGGKYLRVVSSESKTTQNRKEMERDANIGVVSQRVTSLTANMYSKGDIAGSREQNAVWSNYVMNNFNEQKHRSKQEAFSSKNKRLQKALNHKIQKTEDKLAPQMKKQMMMVDESEQLGIKKNLSEVDSDEDEMQLMDNLMEKQNFDLD